MLPDIHSYQGQHVHFIGIGGSSMSGLAGLLQEEGYLVSGSDSSRSHKTEALAEKGIQIFIGHKAENIAGVDLVIYSAAISEDNAERAEAKRLGIPQLERCDLLGQLMDGDTCAICISGTHGKTTTTSMMAQAFITAGVDPSIHIGGELDFIKGSTHRGADNFFICESCEYRRSFLHFKPRIAVITNIDMDHLDYYRDIDDIQSAFQDFTNLLPKDGYCVVWGDDPRAQAVAENAPCAHLTSGLNPDNDMVCANPILDAHGYPTFDAVYHGQFIGHFTLGVASEPNMLDAMAVITVCMLQGLDMKKVAEALNEFVGAHRRFELTSTTDGVQCYTDYGHNPAEIKNALHLAAMQEHREIYSVFQPHTYSRVKTLFTEFLETFDEADHLLITDIMGAREVDPGDINSSMLIEPLRARGIDAVLTPTFDDAESYLRTHWHKGDIMVSHGCGNINLLNEQIAEHGDTPTEKV